MKFTLPVNRQDSGALIFLIFLLLLGVTIRSGFLVDRSFLPRMMLLAIILLFSYLGLNAGEWIRRTSFSIWELIYIVSFTIFYIWNLVSVFWSVAPSEALVGSQLIFLSLILFLVSLLFLKQNQGFESIFLMIVVILMLFACVLAFYRMSTLLYFDPYRILSVCANNNLFAGFLVLAIGMLFAGFSYFRGFFRYLTVPVTVLAFFFLIIVQCRAAYLGVLSAVLIAIFLLILRYRNIFNRRNVIIWSCAAGVLLIGLMLFYHNLDETRRSYLKHKLRIWDYFISYDTIQQKVIRKQRISEADLQKIAAFDLSEEYYENANLRLIFWKKTVPLILENPITGVGTGSWKLVVPKVSEPINPDHTRKNFTYSQPHNEWICLLSELGIPGLILALVVYLLPSLLVFHRLLLAGKKLPVSLVFYASFITGFMFYACFDFPLRRVEHNILLFPMMAFMINGITNDGIRIFIPVGLHRYLHFIFFILLLFTIFLSGTRIMGEFYTFEFFRNERKNDVKVIQYCRKAESIFYRITPNTLPVAWFEGVALFRKGDVEASVDCFERALRSTPYEVRVMNDYAVALWNLQQSEQARRMLRECVRIDPYFDDARFNLAAIHYYSGRSDSALYYVTGCRESEKKREFIREIGKEAGL